jgi:hypothetical protein
MFIRCNEKIFIFLIDLIDLMRSMLRISSFSYMVAGLHLRHSPRCLTCWKFFILILWKRICFFVLPRVCAWLIDWIALRARNVLLLIRAMLKWFVFVLGNWTCCLCCWCFLLLTPTSKRLNLRLTNCSSPFGIRVSLREDVETKRRCRPRWKWARRVET